MLTIGDKLPEFKVKAVIGNDLKSAFIDVTDQTYAGKWQVYFFYPKDFTFICPTEMVAFANLNEDFKSRDAVLLGGSIDSEFVHLAWKNKDETLKDLPYPLIADVKRELSASLGILDRNEGVTLRATVIVDPENTIQHISVNNLSTGRNPNEVLRTLDALQSGELCPVNWKKGDEVISA